jgi:hypothetical protein
LVATALAAVAAPPAQAQGVAAPGRQVMFPGFYVGSGITVIDPENDGRETLRHLDVRSEFSAGPLRVGIDAELRYEDKDLFEFDLRDPDWDETSDYLRWIDYIEIGNRGESYYAVVERLQDARLGHGSLIDHYQSWIDFHSPKTGGQVGSDLGWVGVDGLANDLTDPQVLGGRAWLRPFHTGSGKATEPEFAITAQIATDLDAPKRIKLNAAGMPDLDDDQNYRVKEDEVLAWGLGADLPAMNLFFDMVPYVEWNRIEDFGDGWHFGADLVFGVPGADVNFLARLEWQLTEDEYLPTYFNALYEIDRFRFPRLDSPTTRREALKEVSAANGYLVETLLTISGIQLRGSYQYVDTEEENNLFTLSATLLEYERVRARAFFVRRGVSQFNQVFTFDEQTTLGAEVIFKMAEWSYLDLSYTRSYVLDERTRQYEALDAYSIAVLFGQSF